MNCNFVPVLESEVDAATGALLGVVSPPPGVVSPPPGVVSPPPGVVSPPPGVVSPPPGVVSPPPGVVSPPPGVVSPPPGVVSPPPGVVSPPPGVVSPPPGVVSPPPGVSARLTFPSNKLWSLNFVFSAIYVICFVNSLNSFVVKLGYLRIRTSCRLVCKITHTK